jgi:hypothetical protein
MIVSPEWKFPSLREQRRILANIKQAGRTSLTLLEMTIVMRDAISRWTPDEKAHMRAKLYRKYGLLKGPGGKPS